MIFTPRDYQQKAIDIGIDFFEDDKKSFNALEILPTGSGKSLVIANIVNPLKGKTIILQPSKEILEQNYAKYMSYGGRASIYSASAGSKHVGKVTYATIGSVINKIHLFKDCKNIVIDECFPAGSLVDGRPIEDLKVGDIVLSFNHKNNKIEPKQILNLFKKHADSELLKITLYDKSFFYCTDNHPIYTKEKGYLTAKEIKNINHPITVIKNNYEQKNYIQLCNLFDRMQEKRTRQKIGSLLYKRMPEKKHCNEALKNDYQLFRMQSSNYYRANSKNKFFKDRGCILHPRVFQKISIRKGNGEYKGGNIVKRFPRKIISKDVKKQSNVDERGKRKDDRIIKRKYIFRKGWQRAIYKAASSTSRGYRLTYGTFDYNTRRKTPIPICSKLLQSRFSGCEKETFHRSGWCYAQIEKVEVFRPQENRNIKCIGLDCDKVYKSGSGCRCSEMCTNDFVYNIEVEDNNNYFVNNTLVHNCHLVNADDGMYKTFITGLKNAKVLGLTATPYRLGSTPDGAMLDFLNRSEPRIFKEIIYYIQNQVLFDQGHLAKLKYMNFDVVDREMLEMNAKGTDFTDASVKNYYRKIDMPTTVAKYANKLLRQRRNLLVFCSLISEAERVATMIPGAVVLTGDTEPAVRSKMLAQFKNGLIRCIINVGVLTTGFDYPELECVLMARSTMSLALYYQIVGRIMRPHKNKDCGWFVDLGGNIKKFGKIETMILKIDKKGEFSVWNDNRQLTNVAFCKS